MISVLPSRLQQLREVDEAIVLFEKRVINHDPSAQARVVPTLLAKRESQKDDSGNLPVR